jgi:hypothetical protein
MNRYKLMNPIGKASIRSHVAILMLGAGTLLVSQAGCRDQTPIASSYEPNYLFAKATEIGLSKEEGELEPTIQDSKNLLVEWFGTMEDPKLPSLLKEDDYADLISEANLKIAVGTPSEPGIYIQQCASCHGSSGQGRGINAASQDPYPRDFRRSMPSSIMWSS